MVFPIDLSDCKTERDYAIHIRSAARLPTLSRTECIEVTWPDGTKQSGIANDLMNMVAQHLNPRNPQAAQSRLKNALMSSLLDENPDATLAAREVGRKIEILEYQTPRAPNARVCPVTPSARIV